MGGMNRGWGGVGEGACAAVKNNNGNSVGGAKSGAVLRLQVLRTLTGGKDQL